MKLNKKILRPPSTSLLEAMKVLVENHGQIVLVVDDNRKLLGTVTDGDIRRGILRQVSLESPISEIMKTEPATIGEDITSEACLRIMKTGKLRHLPVLDEQGCVVDLMSLSELLEETDNDNWVVIMAGGLGTRLRPLTATTPKPLVPVDGKPLLEISIERMAAQGFTNFFLSVNYKSEMIMDYFGDGSKLGVKIEYLREDQRLGTAGALSLLPGRPNKPILVMNGDVLTSVNFNQLLTFHDDHEAAATMCVREHDIKVPYGVAEIEGHLLSGMAEKPVYSFFINAGIYSIDPKAIDEVPKAQFFDMPDLLDTLVQKGEEVAVFPLREYWIDVGRDVDLEKAQRDHAQPPEQLK